MPRKRDDGILRFDRNRWRYGFDWYDPFACAPRILDAVSDRPEFRQFPLRLREHIVLDRALQALPQHYRINYIKRFAPRLARIEL